MIDNRISGLSLFANVGIGETYLSSFGIDITVANELLKDRSDFYKFLHPQTDVVCGSICDIDVLNTLIYKAKEAKCDFILATPPCQGMSLAGKKNPFDERNSLVKYVVTMINVLEPNWVILENVPSVLKTKIMFKNEPILIPEYLTACLSDRYRINYKVLNAADYGTPQVRRRAIFLISKNTMDEWHFPKEEEKITVEEAIGHLPSLMPSSKGKVYPPEKDVNSPEEKANSKTSYHYAKKHNEQHIKIMSHTPTGMSAFDNVDEEYTPRKNGKRIKGYNTTYKRMRWDAPAPTITMSNGAISSQNNVHPGRLNEDGTYSDPRVLTLKEIFILTGLPDDWSPPSWAEEPLIRKVIGEALMPELVKRLVKNMPSIKDTGKEK